MSRLGHPCGLAAEVPALSRQRPIGPPITSFARRCARTLPLLHPLPSLINAALVVALATVAGAQASLALVLGLAMLGFQTSIGALNDLVDVDRDRLTRPDKPIPAGLATTPQAWAVTLVGGGLGLAVSAALGPLVLLTGLAGYGCGLAYDLWLRQTGWGWLCFVAAFPLLLAWTWLAAAGSLPPGWPILLPLAALAGPTLHLANSLVDLERDERSGTPSLATRLGPRRGRLSLATLTLGLYGLAWMGLAATVDPGRVTIALAVGATSAAVVGVALSWRLRTGLREVGWILQAGALATLAVAWTVALVA